MDKICVKFLLNDRETEVLAEPCRSLLDVLRYDLAMTGTKCGCNEGECGACSVILDGTLVNSCLIQIANLEGRRVTTIEGLAVGGTPSAIQKAFVAHGAIQCGFCTPGMIMAATALLETNPNPTRGEIKFAISGNICRCTGYDKTIAAIESVARGDLFEENDGVWIEDREEETASCGCEGHGKH